MFQIEELKVLSVNDMASTYEWSAEASKGYLLAYRKAGATFGNHWHQGISKTKDPEVLLFISGEMQMTISGTDGTEKERVDLRAPLKLKIYPYYLHSFEAITDCTFLEFNSLEEHVADTFYPEKK